MSQPVVDTLELCDALRKTGMEHEQAEGMARALGRELGEHVVTQGDMQAGFQQVRSEVRALRSETQAEFQQVRSEVRALRSETQAEFQQVRSEIRAGFQQERAETQAGLQAVDHKVDLLGGRIDSLQATLKTTLTGVALAIAFLALVTGVGLFRTAAPGAWDSARAPAAPAPPPAMVDTAPPNV